MYDKTSEISEDSVQNFRAMLYETLDVILREMNSKNDKLLIPVARVEKENIYWKHCIDTFVLLPYTLRLISNRARKSHYNIS